MHYMNRERFGFASIALDQGIRFGLRVGTALVVGLAIAAVIGIGTPGELPVPLAAATASIGTAPAPAATKRLAARRHEPLLDGGLAFSTRPVSLTMIGRFDGLMDADVALGPWPRPMGQNPPLRAFFRPSTLPRTIVASLPVPPPAAAPKGDADLAPSVVLASVEMEPPLPVARDEFGIDAPLPVPRPADAPSAVRVRPAAPPETETAEPAERPRLTITPRSRRTKLASLAPTVPDSRSFFQRLFGADQSSGSALAYASANDGKADAKSDVQSSVRPRSFSTSLSGFPAAATGGTAVYDISARVVYMPNGERLEAHSGLGDKRDDPRHVDVSMRGATPPHVYDLTERESLFHGVPALRLNPVGGSGAIHGRAGLLAHTYMLGPRGDSNGCVSFKDYNKFLAAYRRGDVKRLVVVANSN